MNTKDKAEKVEVKDIYVKFIPFSVNASSVEPSIVMKPKDTYKLEVEEKEE